eukprot:300389-Hanusia_phi.AAC.1
MRPTPLPTPGSSLPRDLSCQSRGGSGSRRHGRKRCQAPRGVVAAGPSLRACASLYIYIIKSEWQGQ